jgi:hypothetical protein
VDVLNRSVSAFAGLVLATVSLGCAPEEPRVEITVERADAALGSSDPYEVDGIATLLIQSDNVEGDVFIHDMAGPFTSIGLLSPEPPLPWPVEPDVPIRVDVPFEGRLKGRLDEFAFTLRVELFAGGLGLLSPVLVRFRPSSAGEPPP